MCIKNPASFIFLTFILIMSGRKFICFFVIPFILSLSSCSLQKRHYRSGFYTEKKSSVRNSTSVKVNYQEKIVQKKYLLLTNVSQPLTFVEKNGSLQLQKQKIRALHQKKLFVSLLSVNPVKNFTVRKPDIKPALLSGILPNHVAKAGLRMGIISLLFLAAAYYLFLKYPDLVYITVSLLIISVIFALVSIISSASARRDKINNTKAWLNAAILSIILSMLIICCIGLFFILLF
jgi:hypothetical protein